MKILYPANIRFPMERANSVQIIKTCHAMASYGEDVELYVRKMKGVRLDEALGYYGLQAHEKMHIHRLRVINKQYYSRLWNGSFYLSVLPRLMWAARQKGAVLYIRDIGFARKLLKLKIPCPVVYEIHGIDSMIVENYKAWQGEDTFQGDSEKVKRLEKMEAEVISQVDGIVSISEPLAEEVVRRYGVNPEKVIYIPDGCDTPPATLPEEKRERVILYAGQLYPWKGVDLVVEALEFLPGEKLWILGGGTLDESLVNLKAKVKRLNLEDRVVFLGNVPHAEVKSHLMKAGVGVIPLPDIIPARVFTSPLKLFEYMSAGLPIVASDLPTIRSVLQNGENARLYEPENAKALADCLRAMLDAPKKTDLLAKKAFEDADQYSYTNRGKKIVNYLRTFI